MRKILVLLALPIAACQGSPSEPPPDPRVALAGEWILGSVNGHTLPYGYPYPPILAHAAGEFCEVEVLEGVLHIFDVRVAATTTFITTTTREPLTAECAGAGVDYGEGMFDYSTWHAGRPALNDTQITWELDGTALTLHIRLRSGNTEDITGRVVGETIILNADWPITAAFSTIPLEFEYTRTP